MLKVINVVGARPNFMKVAPIVAAMKRRTESLRRLLFIPVNITTRHMSDSFFRDSNCLSLTFISESVPRSHAAQTAAVMERFEPVVLAREARLGAGSRRREFDARLCARVCRSLE